MGQRTFCKMFPFHIIFDKDLIIKQCGASFERLIPEMKNKNKKLTDIMTIVRPHITLDYHSILSQIMSVFVLSTKSGILDIKSTSNGKKKSSGKSHDSTIEEKEGSTRFKGQMVFLKDKELILFQCSPSLMSVDDLFM